MSGDTRQPWPGAAPPINKATPKRSGLLDKADKTKLDGVAAGAGPSTNVAVTAPITNAGTATAPTIGIGAATTAASGSMSAADKTKLDAVATSVNAPLTNFGTATAPNLGISAATGSAAGSMSAFDKTKLDGLGAANVPRVLVYNSAAMTISNDLVVTLLFDSEDFDTDGMFAAGFSSNSITIKTAGHYLIGAQGNWSEAAAEGERKMMIYQYGTYQAATSNFFWAGTLAFARLAYHTVSIVRACNVGDTFQVRVYQKSAGTLQISDYHLYAFKIG